MGRVNMTDAPAAKIHHFSHPHELEFFNLQNQLQGFNVLNPIQCSGCKLPASGSMYTCRPCNFTLHLACTNFPKLITHPSHPTHTLTLLPIPSYPGGKFNCDACNRYGDGFSFHCNSCEFDLHVTCATKPLQITHQMHSCLLQLTFKNPYEGAKGFSCDACSKMGSKQWLYRCNKCEFDIHLDCASATPRPAVQAQQHHPSFFNNQGPVAAFPQNQFQQFPGQQVHGFQHSASFGPIPQNQFHQRPGFAGQQANGLMHCASVGQIPQGQRQQGPAVLGQPAHGLMHSASVGAIPQNQFGAVRPNHQFQHSASTGSIQNYQNQQPSMANGLMNAALQGIVEGVTQQVGQTIMQNITGGGGNGGNDADGNDGSSFLGGFFEDDSDAQY